MGVFGRRESAARRRDRQDSDIFRQDAVTGPESVPFVSDVRSTLMA